MRHTRPCGAHLHPSEAACQHCVNKSRGARWRQKAVASCPSADQLRPISSHQSLQALAQAQPAFQSKVIPWPGRAGANHALVESERVLDIAVEPEAVGFEIGAIWAGRQVDGDVMCAVADLEG